MPEVLSKIPQMLSDRELKRDFELANSAFSREGVIRPVYAPGMTQWQYFQDSGLSQETVEQLVDEEGNYKGQSYQRNLQVTSLDTLMLELPSLLRTAQEAAQAAVCNSEEPGYNDHGPKHARYTSTKGLDTLEAAGYEDETLQKVVFVGMQLHDLGLWSTRDGHWETGRRIAKNFLEHTPNEAIEKQAILGLIGWHESVTYKHLLKRALEYIGQYDAPRKGDLDRDAILTISKAVAIIEDKIDIGIRRMNPKVTSGKDFINHPHSLFQALFRTSKFGYEISHAGEEDVSLREAVCIIDFNPVLKSDTYKKYSYITTAPLEESQENEDLEGAPIDVPPEFKTANGDAADFEKSTDFLLRLNRGRFVATAIASLVLFSKNRFADQFTLVIRNTERQGQAKKIVFHRDGLLEDIEAFLEDYDEYEPNPTPQEYPPRIKQKSTLPNINII